jgi:hypothetical protein
VPVAIVESVAERSRAIITSPSMLAGAAIPKTLSTSRAVLHSNIRSFEKKRRKNY